MLPLSSRLHNASSLRRCGQIDRRVKARLYADMGREYGHDWRSAVASALDWWADAGVDTLTDEAPRDWLARTPPRAEAPVPETIAATAPPLPDDLERFVAWRMGDAAPEAEWLSPRIAPGGPAGAAMMVLTDMPEPGDEAAGMMIGGAAGRLLDRILEAIGESRDSVQCAALAWARPVTGTLNDAEIAQLAPLVHHHVALAAPKRLLLLGETMNRVWRTTNNSASVNPEGDINQFVGNKENVQDVVAIRHPRFLLSHPASKAEAWKQLVQWSGG